MKDKFYGMLGLAMRAGAAAAGEGKALEAIRRGKAKVLLLSADASENTRKKFMDACSSRDVPVIEGQDRFRLGEAIGRAYAVSVAVTNQNFAVQLLHIAKAEA